MTSQDYFNLVLNTAIKDGMPDILSSLIAGQSAHESGNYQSKLFRTDNNCFGYKYVKGSSHQAAKGILSPEGDYYAHYATIEDSVHEICAWINRRRNEKKFPDLITIKYPKQYANLLKACGYFGDTADNYAKGINYALGEFGKAQVNNV